MISLHGRILLFLKAYALSFLATFKEETTEIQNRFRNKNKSVCIWSNVHVHVDSPSAVEQAVVCARGQAPY